MRTVVACVAVLGAVVSGWGAWRTIAPGEEGRKEILKRLPEADPGRMEESRKRNALMMEVLKEAAETKENVARGYRTQK